MPNKEEITNWLKKLQDRICTELEALDGSGHFKQDLWKRPEGGGGRTRVLTNGTIIEKGCILVLLKHQSFT